MARAAPAHARVRVRPAALADAERIATLRLALLAEHKSNAVYARMRRDAPARAIELTEEQLTSECEAIFVATRKDRIVGMIRCIDQRGHRLLRPSRFALISTVYVEPRFRRQGILRSLMDAAVAWTRERGLNEMRLQNAIDNPIAIAAWDALGFEVVEQTRLRRL